MVNDGYGHAGCFLSSRMSDEKRVGVHSAHTYGPKGFRTNDASLCMQNEYKRIISSLKIWAKNPKINIMKINSCTKQT